MIVGDLLRMALLNAGVIKLDDTVYADDMYLALNHLSALLAQWQRRRWLVWSLVDVVLVSTGATSYPIGPGSAFNVARPDRIDSAFVRYLSAGLSGNPSLAVDYPLGIIESREDYNLIAIKGLSTFPAAVFYDSAYPVGNVFIWPVPPAANYEIHLSVKTALQGFSNLTDTITSPPEYIDAMIYALASKLCMAYGMPVRPDLATATRVALNTLRMANAQVATLQLPPGLLGRHGGMSLGRFLGGGW